LRGFSTAKHGNINLPTELVTIGQQRATDNIHELRFWQEKIEREAKIVGRLLERL
jgi:hypothetical protein